MNGRESLKDLGREQRVFATRAIVAIIVTVLLTGVIVARLVNLQVMNYEHFQSLSKGNRMRIEPLPPTRGLIFDRNGVLLAENIPAYQLELVPEQVADIDDTLSRLRTLGLLRPEDETRFRSALRKSHRRFNPIPLRFRLTEDELARFAVQRQHFEGVDIRPRLSRYYPLGATAVHAIGYVGSLSATDVERLDGPAYAGTTHVGKIGIEKAYEDALHGDVGYQQVLVNAQGRALEVVHSVPPRPGMDLYLTLDVAMQESAERALGEHRGAVVAIDVSDGGILALASTPGFDPNPFGEGLSTAQYKGLTTNPDKPLFNRALAGQYPPGSTVKPMLGLASLQHHTLNPRDKLFCPGHFSLPGNAHRYRDWKKTGHGSVDFNDAIAQSCDVYFYQLAIDLGIDRMHDFLAPFGFGSRTGIDIKGEATGLLPSREWKRNNFSRRSDQVWFPGETVITGIGQGFFLATPLQLAHATAIVAARGQRFKPRLIDGVRDPLTGDIERRDPVQLPPVQVDDDAYWEQVIHAMESVVYGERGTARSVGAHRDYRVAGKTGTAQVFTVGQDDVYDEDDVAEELRHHGWFIAFAPLERPEVAVAILVENGGGGSSSAAPVARKLFDTYFGYEEAL